MRGLVLSHGAVTFRSALPAPALFVSTSQSLERGASAFDDAARPGAVKVLLDVSPSE